MALALSQAEDQVHRAVAPMRQTIDPGLDARGVDLGVVELERPSTDALAAGMGRVLEQRGKLDCGHGHVTVLQ